MLIDYAFDVLFFGVVFAPVFVGLFLGAHPRTLLKVLLLGLVPALITKAYSTISDEIVSGHIDKITDEHKAELSQFETEFNESIAKEYYVFSGGFAGLITFHKLILVFGGFFLLCYGTPLGHALKLPGFESEWNSWALVVIVLGGLIYPPIFRAGHLILAPLRGTARSTVLVGSFDRVIMTRLLVDGLLTMAEVLAGVIAAPVFAMLYAKKQYTFLRSVRDAFLAI